MCIFQLLLDDCLVWPNQQALVLPGKHPPAHHSFQCGQRHFVFKSCLCCSHTAVQQSALSLSAVLCHCCHWQASFRAWTSAPMTQTRWQQAPIPLQLQCMTSPQAQPHLFCRGIKAASHRCSTAETCVTVAKQSCTRAQAAAPVDTLPYLAKHACRS